MNCAVCPTPIKQYKHYYKRYCSQSCRLIVANKRNREYKRLWMRKFRNGLIKRHPKVKPFILPKVKYNPDSWYMGVVRANKEREKPVIPKPLPEPPRRSGKRYKWSNGAMVPMDKENPA